MTEQLASSDQLQLGTYVDGSPAYAVVPAVNWLAPSWPGGVLPGAVTSGRYSLFQLITTTESPLSWFPPMPPAGPLPPAAMSTGTKVALLAGAGVALIVAAVAVEAVLLATWPEVGVPALLLGPLLLLMGLTSEPAAEIFGDIREWLDDRDGV